VAAYGAVLAGGDLVETFAFSDGFDGSSLMAVAVGKGSPLLDYLFFELAFSLLAESRWSAVVRIHRRSGAWGTFDGDGEGSNYRGAGFRCGF